MRKAHARLLAVTLILAFVVMAAPDAARPYNVPDPRRVETAAEDVERIRASRIRTQAAWWHAVDAEGELAEGIQVSYARFDRNGNPLEVISYGRDGAIVQRLTNEYDAAGFLLESVSEGLSGPGDTQTVFEYAGNLLIESVTYRSDGSVLVSTVYEYDGDGRMTGTTGESPDGSFYQRIAFEHDANGDVTETITFGPDDQMLSRAVNVYDGDGRPVELVAYGPDGSVATNTSYEYDGDANLVALTVRSAAGAELQTVTNSYDADGVVVETTAASPVAGTSSRVTFEHDESGNRTAENTYNKLGQLVSRTVYVQEYYGDEEE